MLQNKGVGEYFHVEPINIPRRQIIKNGAMPTITKKLM